MFKRNIFKILAIVFFLLSGITFVYSNNTGLINQTPTPKKSSPSKIPTIILSPTIFIKGSENPTPTIIPTQPIQPATNSTVSPTASSPTSAPQALKVSLTINKSSVGSIELSQGANQCDVLSQALSQGKIQSLNMRYNNDYGTNAVYQINGIGKENAVWWGFKVNGQSPNQGCSYIKVNSGDSVEWEYVGN